MGIQCSVQAAFLTIVTAIIIVAMLHGKPWELARRRSIVIPGDMSNVTDPQKTAIPLLSIAQVNATKVTHDAPNKTTQLATSEHPTCQKVTLALVGGWKDNATLLEQTLYSWQDGGLLQFASERLAALNPPTQIELRKPSVNNSWGALQRLTRRFGFSLIPLDRWRVIGEVLHRLVTHASGPLVLFVEKDFLLVEPKNATLKQLVQGCSLIEEGTAQVVRYRSRVSPGFPNFQEIVYRGKEGNYSKSNSTMGNVCNAFYWKSFDEMVALWPQIQASQCTSDNAVGPQPFPASLVSSTKQRSSVASLSVSRPNISRSQTSTETPGRSLPRGFMCVPARFCTWTNNPVLFRKDFWDSTIAPQVKSCLTDHTNYCLEAAQHKADINGTMPYTVALPERGLFSHYDPHKYKDFFLKYRLKEKRLAAERKKLEKTKKKARHA